MNYQLIASNIVIKNNVIKIMDFSECLNLNIPKISEYATLEKIKVDCMGTIPYLAPEQLNDEIYIDTRTEVWALGITLMQIL